MAAFDLASALTSACPRERSGSQTVGRYGFQANVGILKLLELHEGSKDFRLVFDIYDDLVVLSPSDVPAEISLFQVKSRDPGQWTTSDLCNRVGKKAPRSIVARLYGHEIDFGPAVVTTAFISNASFKVRLQSGSPSSGDDHYIAGTAIHSDDALKITDAVVDDFDAANVPAWLPKFALIRTTLGVHGQELVIKGRLHEHFSKAGYGGSIDLTAVFETLHGSIEQKTGFSQVGADPLDGLKRKSITRRDFEELLDRAAHHRRGFLADWDSILYDLQTQGFGSIKIIKIKTAAISHHQRRLCGHPDAVQLQNDSEVWLSSNANTVATCQSITELASLLQSGVVSDYGYGKDLLGALIVEAYEAVHARA